MPSIHLTPRLQQQPFLSMAELISKMANHSALLLLLLCVLTSVSVSCPLTTTTTTTAISNKKAVPICCFYSAEPDKCSSCSSKAIDGSWCAESADRCTQCHGTWCPSSPHQKARAPPSYSLHPVPTTAQVSPAAPSPPPSPLPAPPAQSSAPTTKAITSPSTPPKSSECGASAIFCEDFESLPVGSNVESTKWRLEGSASITGTGARGTRALYLNPTGGKFGRLVVDNFSPPGNSFYGRMYTKVDKFATGPPFAHFVMTEVLGKQGEERLRPIGGQYVLDGPTDGVSLWGVGSDGGQTGDWTSWQKTAPTTDGVWTCLEWEMLSADNSVKVWIDGKSKPELSVSTKKHGGRGDLIFPKFESIWFGWWVFQGDTTPAQFDVYIDDIVLGTERVGCK